MHFSFFHFYFDFTAFVALINANCLIRFLQADEKEKDLLKIKIETAIAALNGPQNSISSFEDKCSWDLLKTQ